MAQNIEIEKIKTDGGTQARASLNEDIVAEYAEAIIAGANMPPVTVFHDGKVYWLADGFHRFHAHRKARAIEIYADVIAGAKRDAILHSVGANAHHGLRRTNEDKRASVLTLLGDKEWKTWSDRQIAEACGVSHPFVAAIRNPVKAVKQEANRKASESSSDQIVNREVQVESFTTDASKTAPQSHSSETVIPVSTVIPSSKSESANDDGPDLSELVDELQSENTRLTAMMQAAQADDLAAEAIKWRSAYDRSIASQSEAMDAAARSEKREKFTKKQLMRCGKAVGVDDPTKIAAAVESALREVRRAAA